MFIILYWHSNTESDKKEVIINMQLVRFDPLRSLLDDEFSMPTAQKGLKIHETDKAIVVEAVIAGVSKENVEVEIEDGILTIKAEDKKEKDSKNEHWSSSYQYYYTTALSGGEWDKAEADITNGIIKVEIPKAESARPRKITVKLNKRNR